MTPAEKLEIEYLTTLLVHKYSKKFSFVPGYTHKREQTFDRLFGLLRLKYSGFREEVGLYNSILNQHTILDKRDFPLFMMIQMIQTNLTILKNMLTGISLEELSNPNSGFSARINFICKLINELDNDIEKIRKLGNV